MQDLWEEIAGILGKTPAEVEAMAERRTIQTVLQVDDLDVGTRIQVARVLKGYNDVTPVTDRVVLSGLQTNAAPAAHH